MKMKFDKQEQGVYSKSILEQTDRSRIGVKVKVTPMYWFALLLIVCSPLIFFIIKFSLHFLTVHAHGYVTLPQVEIRVNENGYIGDLSVKPGQLVKSGEFLCKLEQPELKKKESLLESELAYLQDNPVNKATGHKVSATPINLNLAGRQKNYMKKRLDEVVQLFDRGAASETEVTSARFQYEQALAHFVDSEASVLRAKDVTVMMRSVAGSKDALRIKELVLEKEALALQTKAASIYSPVLGSVSDVFATEGGYVSKGDLIFTVTKNEKTRINVYLSPENKYVKLGQVAKIVFADGERVSAKVVETSPIVEPSGVKTSILSSSKNHEIMIQLEFTQPVRQKLVDALPVDVLL